MTIIPEIVRWLVYSILHRILHGRCDKAIFRSAPPKETESFCWIFCSTIGELNACKLLIQHYCSTGKVLLLTDREIYVDSFKSQFPMAEVAVADIDFRKTALTISRYPPHLAIVCEIPVLLHDAPCRLSYGVLRALKKYQVRICLVNGWLYGYKPACKQDYIEKLLFEQDYLNCFDILSVQTDEVKQVLISQGAYAHRVVVTGNMKYDNLNANLVLTAQTQELLDMLKHYNQLFVAGCVTDVWEYNFVVSAFVKARQNQPDLKLIIAPRHPEKPEQLAALVGILQQNILQYDFRSMIAASWQLKDVLIIDTFGELKAFYSIASLCYVGINHNILEPLSLGKSVAVLENWEPRYPSYPVFKIAESNSMIFLVESEEDLAEFLTQSAGNRYSSQKVLNKLQILSGAFSRNLEQISMLVSIKGN
ncbi:3-deoxy-D-manno-octulosonic acid transferase [Alishewanella jeotgali]|nr:glycosyltransferase N-terminal domain-containing protein [Alishewanella jeotgali]